MKYVKVYEGISVRKSVKRRRVYFIQRLACVRVCVVFAKGPRVTLIPPDRVSDCIYKYLRRYAVLGVKG